MTLRDCIKQELQSPRKSFGTIVVYRVKDSRRYETTNYSCADWARQENRPAIAEIYRGDLDSAWEVSTYRKPTKAEKAIIESFAKVTL